MIRELNPSQKNPIEEIIRRLAEESHRHNLTPDPEMGDLNPEQVTRLVYLSWESDENPLTLCTTLTLSQVSGSVLLGNCRRFLVALQEKDGVRATSSGNLPRSFVAEMLDSLVIDEDRFSLPGERERVLREAELPELHILRVVCEAARLIRRVKGRFRVTRKREKLLRDERAGELYAFLFHAYFRRFNLAYQDWYPQCPGLQTCAAYTFYRLGKTARAWADVAELPGAVLLPSVLEEVREAGTTPLAAEPWRILARRILWPLLAFDLLEGRTEVGSYGIRQLRAVRVTPLYDAFMRFPGLP